MTLDLLFIGSIPGHRPGELKHFPTEHRAFAQAAFSLGYAAAEAGHRIHVGSESPRTADRNVADGAVQFARHHSKREVDIFVHRPKDGRYPFQDVPENVHLHQLLSPRQPDASVKWFLAHSGALEHADALLTIGGGRSTRFSGLLALDRHVPLVPIACFGGTSDELHDRCQRELDTLSDSSVLATPWSDDSSSRILKLTKRLLDQQTGPPKDRYFISYSWKDSQSCDLCELVLRRSNRQIDRDELGIKLGEEIKPRLFSMIEQADTFIILWSQHSAASSWCRKELEHAIQLQRQNRPRRVILVQVDDLAPPEEHANVLYARGASRDNMLEEIAKIVQQEDR